MGFTQFSLAVSVAGRLYRRPSRLSPFFKIVAMWHGLTQRDGRGLTTRVMMRDYMRIFRKIIIFQHLELTKQFLSADRLSEALF